MTAYLTFIGVMNALGALLMIGALKSSFSDLLLRKLTYILPADKPFEHGAYTHIWLWWAIIATSVLSALNFVAVGWPPEYARVIIWGNIAAYSAFEVLAIGGTFSKNYGPGIYIAHGLWIGQAAWGVVTVI